MADTKILDVYIPCKTCGTLIPAGGNNRCLTCRLIDLALEPKLKWISVDERLPDKGVIVLVYGSRGGVYTAYLARDGKYPLWHKRNSKSHYCKPTHWMPLPEPPKGE